jgi:Outer membrane protein beta-barrel domain
MKKLILSVFAVFVMLSGFAQTVSFGVKAGINFSNQSLSGYALYGLAKNQSTTGFNVGGIMDIGFGNFSIQPGLFYSTKGEEIPAHPNQNAADGPTDYIIPTATYNFRYIELPVNFIYNAPVSKALRIQFGAGPYFGYGVSADTKTFYAQIPGSFDDSQSPGGHYKNPDIGANFLAGLEVEKRFLIDVQYSVGLVNVSNIHNAYPASDIKNRVFSVSVGYLFR